MCAIPHRARHTAQGLLSHRGSAARSGGRCVQTPAPRDQPRDWGSLVSTLPYFVVKV